jgi:hypothetical protein
LLAALLGFEGALKTAAVWGKEEKAGSERNIQRASDKRARGAATRARATLKSAGFESEERTRSAVVEAAYRLSFPRFFLLSHRSRRRLRRR